MFHLSNLYLTFFVYLPTETKREYQALERGVAQFPILSVVSPSEILHPEQNSDSTTYEEPVLSGHP